MKRDATAQEIEAGLAQNKQRNPGVDVRARWEQALTEGFKDEVCGKCNVTFLAHHHFIRCDEVNCPMKGGDHKTVLQILAEVG